MAFLDNSGDIILDAVLTDTGRMRLAKGDGNFKIVQFAFGDDEINYGLYNKNHPSGSAYYDLDILQTPVLEAFTNNTSVLKYQLMSNMRNDLLFLPVALLNTSGSFSPFAAGFSSYLVTSNVQTLTSIGSNTVGVMDGNSQNPNTKQITIDQGLNSNQTDTTINLERSDNTLYEGQYSVELDYNLLRLTDNLGNIVEPSSIDDDNFAMYLLDRTQNQNFITTIANPTGAATKADTILAGTAGSRLEFKLRVSTQVNISTEIFTRLGGNFNPGIGSLGAGTYYIDTSIRVKGLTTGVSTTVPIKIIKAA
jgi:hypothetical protein